LHSFQEFEEISQSIFPCYHTHK